MPNEAEVEVNYETIKKRSVVGIASLISRTFLLQGVAFATNLLLGIFLDPKTFGVFFLVTASINIFHYFSDIGLSAALIQKREQINEEDLKTTFTVQQALVGLLVIIIFAISPFLKKTYGFDQSSIHLLYALAITFFFTSLKTIPSVLLERSLKFNLLIIPQILESVVYSLMVVFFAWKGLGISSFTYAVLAQGIVGLVSIYIVSPWRIGFAFSRESLKKLLRFGIPYQANTFVAAAKDDLMIMFLGKIIGSSGIGYLGWAKRWSEQPLRVVMDNVSKVAFPAFSRIQDAKENLSKGIEKSLFFLSFLTFPFLVGFSILAADLVKIIPRYTKWEPALFALYLYCFNSAWASISTPMTNLLNAIGKIKTTFKLMLMWLFLTWALMPIMGIKFGYNGVAVATAIIAVSSIVAIVVARKIVHFNLIQPVVVPLVSSLLMGGVMIVLKPAAGSIYLSIAFRVLIAFISYFLFSLLFLRKALFENITLFFRLAKRKP